MEERTGMSPDKDYIDAVNTLASRIVDVSKRKIGSKQIFFTDGMFICAEVSQASQNIMASPTSSVAHIYACACANIALGVAITLDDKELIADMRTLKDILELHFRKMLFEKEELTNG